jgi:hypothetical protein
MKLGNYFCLFECLLETWRDLACRHRVHAFAYSSVGIWHAVPRLLTKPTGRTSPYVVIFLSVIPAKAGIHGPLENLDSRFRGNDGVGENAGIHGPLENLDSCFRRNDGMEENAGIHEPPERLDSRFRGNDGVEKNAGIQTAGKAHRRSEILSAVWARRAVPLQG